MTVFDTRQFGWQRLATGAAACLGWTWRLQRCQFGLHRRQVGIDGFVEQIQLLAAIGFTGLAEAEALVMRQFQRQCLDLDVLGVSSGGLGLLLSQQNVELSLFRGDLLVLLRQHGRQLRNKRRVGVGQGKLFEQIHDAMLTESR